MNCSICYLSISMVVLIFLEMPIRICLFYYFSKEVLYCCDRMIPYHTGSCIAHCLSYLLLHLWLVAVDRTLFARRFLFSELTMVQALIGIVKQSRTLFAKPFSCVLLPITVYLHHLPYCSLLLFYVCHTSLICSNWKQR